jgi:ketosteroid isomerase-like protein
MNKQQINTLVHDLYQAVDNKDIDYLKNNLAKQSRFRIGNSPAATDKTLILEGNRQFFASIKSMKHRIEDIVFQVSDKPSTTKINCYGTVDYVRLDGSAHSVVFSTFLEVQSGLITDYLVFADLSGL